MRNARAFLIALKRGMDIINCVGKWERLTDSNFFLKESFEQWCIQMRMQPTPTCFIGRYTD